MNQLFGFRFRNRMKFFHKITRELSTVITIVAISQLIKQIHVLLRLFSTIKLNLNPVGG